MVLQQSHVVPRSLNTWMSLEVLSQTSWIFVMKANDFQVGSPFLTEISLHVSSLSLLGFCNTVDGSEIQWSPVEVGSWNPIICSFFASQVVFSPDFFQPSTGSSSRLVTWAPFCGGSQHQLYGFILGCKISLHRLGWMDGAESLMPWLVVRAKFVSLIS